jgi:hypothetical protein
VSRILVRASDEVTEDWGKLRDEEVYNGHASLNMNKIVKSVMRCVGYVARKVEKRIEVEVFVGTK